MSGLEIPKELIGYYEDWDDGRMVEVEAVLVEDVPRVVAAELERLSDKYGQEAKRKDEWAEVQDTHDRHHGEGESHAYSDVADELLAIAARLRGEQ